MSFPDKIIVNGGDAQYPLTNLTLTRKEEWEGVVGEGGFVFDGVTVAIEGDTIVYAYVSTDEIIAVVGVDPVVGLDTSWILYAGKPTVRAYSKDSIVEPQGEYEPNFNIPAQPGDPTGTAAVTQFVVRPARLSVTGETTPDVTGVYDAHPSFEDFYSIRSGEADEMQIGWTDWYEEGEFLWVLVTNSGEVFAGPTDYETPLGEYVADAETGAVGTALVGPFVAAGTGAPSLALGTSESLALSTIKPHRSLAL